MSSSEESSTSTPRVNVVMSTFNGEHYIEQAVESILHQTFADFELIIVDDGSTDRTAEILSSYDDPRLRVIRQANAGLTASLNHGIASAQGEYIARMDDDDIATPERLSKQVAFLDAHPSIGVIGTAYRIIDEISGREWEPKVPTSDHEVRRHLIRGNPFAHSSVMLRKAVLLAAGGYDESYPHIQDYELWVRLAQQTRLVNLPEVLTIHRFHWGTVSTNRETEALRLWLRMRIRYRAFRSLNYPFYYFPYVFQPILLTLLELRPKLAGYLRSRTR